MAKSPKTRKSKTANSYLQEIVAMTGSRECVFRGQADVAWKLISGAERLIESAYRTSGIKGAALNTSIEKGLEANLKQYHYNMLDQARINGFGLMDGRKLEDLEILATMQHVGASTALIDFTSRAAVALFFACIDSLNKDGAVYIIPYDRSKIISTEEADIKFSKLFEDGDWRFLQPIIHGDAERRILIQAGLFLINLRSLDLPVKTVEIAKEDKEDVLEELSSAHHITKQSLFMDLSGFASSWSDNTDRINVWRSLPKGDVSERFTLNFNSVFPSNKTPKGA